MPRFHISVVYNPAARGERARFFKERLRQLGSDIRLRPTRGPGDARHQAAEALREGSKTIVATGGIPHATRAAGAQNVLDSWDVLTGAKKIAGSALVYDDHGGNQALDLCEALVRMGVQVELVTPERNVSPEVGGMVASQYFKSLSQAGVRFTPLRQLKSVQRNSDGTLQVHIGVEDESWSEIGRAHV